MGRNQRSTKSIWAGLLALLILTAPMSAAFAERRVALIIGNSRYTTISPLTNPEHDAQLMAETLQSLQFTLLGGKAQLNLTKTAFERTVQEFGRALQDAEVALFYYAGHGLEVRGTNFLVPIEANLTNEADVDFALINTTHILRQMEGPRTRLKLLLLDACRNNPFAGRGWRALATGLAPMDAPAGTLISYATKPGAVAHDGTDGHSPYTRALAAMLRTPGLDVFNVFNKTAVAVKQSTQGAQEPWQTFSPLEGPPFYFSDAPPELALTPTPTILAPTPTLAPTPAPPAARLMINCDDLRLKMSLGVEQLSPGAIQSAGLVAQATLCFDRRHALQYR